MPDIDLSPPLLGLSDEQSFHNQPQGFSRELVNVRPRCPRTGRRMLAHRGGLVKACVAQMDGASPVRLLTQGLYPNPALTTWANQATPPSLFDIPTPSKGPSKNLVVDAQGNIYYLNGNAGVIKLNPQFKQLWTIAVPLKDPAHQLRGLAVDPITLDVYVSVGIEGGSTQTSGSVVSEGAGDQQLACIWRYSQEGDDKTELRWELVTGRWVIDMKLHAPSGRLYTLDWESDRYRSHIVVYRGLDAAAPDVEWEREVSARSRCIQVKYDGSVLWAADPFDLRGLDPKSPGTGPRTVAWTLANLARKSERLWAELRADKINGADIEDEYAEGDEILSLVDHSGNDRNLYASATATPTSGSPVTILRPPLYSEIGLGGEPALRFLGKQLIFPQEGIVGSFASGMESLQNNSINANYQNSQRGLLPAFTGSAWCAFLLFRPKIGDSAEPLADSIFPVFSTQNKAPAYVAGNGYLASRSAIGVHVNRNASDDIGLAASTFSAGKVSAYEITDDAAAFGGNSPDDGGAAPFMPAGNTSWQTNNIAGACLVTWLNSAGVAGNNNTTAATRSIIRVNGLQVDRYASYAFEALVKATIGWVLDPSTEQDSGYYQGELCDIIVLARRRNDVTAALTATEPIVLSHPVGTPAGNYIPVTMPAVLGGATVTATNNEMELIEGMLMHRRGCQRYLDANHPWLANVPPTPTVATGSQQDPQRMHAFGSAVIGKLDAQGKILWIASDERSTISTVTNATLRGAGLALGISGSTDADGTYTPNDGNVIFSVGPGTTNWTFLIDNGNFYTNGGQGAFALPATLLDPPWQMAVDQKNNFWVPVYNTDANPSNFSVAGFQLNNPIQFIEIDLPAGGGSIVPAYACAVPLSLAPYPFNMASQRAQFLYVAAHNTTLAGTTGQDSIYKLELVSSVNATGAPRVLKDYAVTASGRIMRFTTGTVAGPLGLTSPQLSATGQYFDAAVLKDKVFFCDGERYVFVRPEQGLNGNSYILQAKGAGEPKPRGKQLAAWGGRLVIVDSLSLHMSAIDDPFNWDLEPIVLTPADSFDGSVGPAAQPPDIINAFATIRDDLAIAGGDRGIYRITGNPNGGGVADLISTETGISFGKSTCLVEGVLYFHGSRGGIWAMDANGGVPKEITRGLIARRIRQINLAQYWVALVWNDHPSERGLYVIPIPFGSSNTLLKRWFMDAEDGGWWEDTQRADAWISSVAVYDGDDPSDRRLVFGCSDGFVREYSPTADTDDGAQYSSKAIYSMLRGEGDGSDVELTVEQTDVVPALGQGAVTWAWMGGENPEKGVGGGVPTSLPPVDLGMPLLIGGTAMPGGSRSIDRVSGRFIYFAATGTGAWAMERVTARVYANSRSRIR